MKVFTAQQMRDFDKAATEEYGIPSIVLMENAALRVVEFLEAKFAPLSDKKVVILCGKGNNGGDGFAIARHVRNAGAYCTVFFTFAKEEADDLKGDAKTNYEIFRADYISQHRSFNDKMLPPTVTWIWDEKPDIVIDALLGTGVKGGTYDDHLDNALILCLERMDATLVSADIPSGINADTGEKFTRRITADYTITFASPKRGLFVQSGVNSCGEIWVGDIGASQYQTRDTKTGIETLDLETAQRLMPRRPIDAHKGDAGRALIIGGSFGMSGAIALASRASLNVGAGLCIAAMPEKILGTFAASILEATSHPLPCDESGKLLEKAADELPELWKNVQVVALGPGISRSDEAQKFVQRVVKECPVPLVIDADALHALPDIAEEVKAREADTVLTPHPGEMGTLMGISAQEVNDARFETVEACAQKYGAVVVLKGARSLVATPKGEIFVNLTGNAGMATGGSGDVLTGTIAGLLAQLKDAENATKLGVYLHGYTGDLAFEEKGNGLVAGDIAGHLGQALVEVPQREVERINGRLRRLM